MAHQPSRRIVSSDEPSLPADESAKPSRAERKDAPDSLTSLARAIVSGGNPSEQLERWARVHTREYRLEQALRGLTEAQQADARRRFYLSEGEEAYLEAAEEAGIKREDALRRLAKQEGF